jgi:hypothetical protein
MLIYKLMTQYFISFFQLPECGSCIDLVARSQPSLKETFLALEGVAEKENK